MSLINDALLKAERERAEEAAARAAGQPVDHPKYRAEKRRTSRQLQSIPLALVNTAVLLACFAVVILVALRNRPASESASDPVATSALSDTDFARSNATDSAASTDPSSLAESSAFDSTSSPFASTEPLPTPEPASADFELVGMSALGSNTLLGIVRRSDQRSVWVPVGKSVSGITAVSFDPESDRAVIRVDGREHTVALRTGGPIAAE